MLFYKLGYSPGPDGIGHFELYLSWSLRRLEFIEVLLVVLKVLFLS
jgi:hypothetical protein